MLKSRLQKTDGLTHTKLKENISKVLREIPKEKYTNIFKGAYKRDTTYVKKTSRMRRKLKNYKVYKVGVLNEKRCKRVEQQKI